MTIRTFSLSALVLGLALTGVAARVAARQAVGDPEAAKITNPVAATPASVAAGKTTYSTMCVTCHGADAKGGIVLSVIEDKGGNQPPDLTDAKWDHGSTDGEIFTVIKKGVAPDFFMTPWDGRITDTDIWNVINYLRSLHVKT